MTLGTPADYGGTTNLMEDLVSTAPPLIRGMDVVHVPITDFARSDGFYGSALSLHHRFAPRG
jgi:hypothetical protein